ncbi:hypothetical protein HYS54_04130 [Candidatus Micrarchaeota archaeon]|nr:hypothetical protein [Candidatus Micrarchaeota archaeon]
MSPEFAQLLRDFQQKSSDTRASCYWEEKGWRRINNTFVGIFQSGKIECAGEIVERAGQVETYIYDPPPEIRRHQWAPCLFYVGIGKFRVNIISNSPRTVDAAILGVEAVLAECRHV